MNPWIQTFTGRKVCPLAAEPAQICIEDIAHALSMKCRFGGHCREFYSVAQHSVHVSEVVAGEDGSPLDQLAALLHDAPEAYGPDFCKPVKAEYSVYVPLAHAHALESISIGAAEDRLLGIIHTALGLPALDAIPGQHLVKRADLILLCTEQRDLMGPAPEPWSLTAPYLWNRIVPVPPGEARTQFLRRFERLRKLLPNP